MTCQADSIKDALVDFAAILVAYYRDYISGMQSSFVAQHFQKEGILPSPKIYTKSIHIKNITSDWLTQQAKRTIPELQIDRYLLTQASNRVFSFFIDRHKESLHAYIDSQLETAGMTVYGVKISFTKITFGVACFLKEKYEEESVRKENFRQNLQTLINNSTMNPDEREVNGDDSTDW